MLAGRGPVYTSQTVDFRTHDLCGCTGEIVYGDWEPTELERRWRQAYVDAGNEASVVDRRRVAPKKGNGDDTILWRMRRDNPDLFHDGWKANPLISPKAKSRVSTLDGTVHYDRWTARRETLATRLRNNPVPGAKLPPRYPVDIPAEWDQKLATLQAKEWNHILFSDKNGGGHLAGYGWINGGTEFDPAWGHTRILDAMAQTVRKGVLASSGKSARLTIGLSLIHI